MDDQATPTSVAETTPESAEPEPATGTSSLDRGRRLVLWLAAPKVQTGLSVGVCILTVLGLGLLHVDSTEFGLNARVRWAELVLADNSERGIALGGDLCRTRLAGIRFNSVTTSSAPDALTRQVPWLAEFGRGNWLNVTAEPGGSLAISSVAIPRPATVMVEPLRDGAPVQAQAGTAADEVALSFGLARPIQFTLAGDGAVRFQSAYAMSDPIVEPGPLTVTVPPNGVVRFQHSGKGGNEEIFCHGTPAAVVGLRFGRLTPAPPESSVLNARLRLPYASPRGFPNELEEGQWLVLGQLDGAMNVFRLNKEGALTVAYRGKTDGLKVGESHRALATRMPTMLASLTYNPTWKPIVGVLLSIVGLVTGVVRWVRTDG